MLRGGNWILCSDLHEWSVSGDVEGHEASSSPSQCCWSVWAVRRESPWPEGWSSGRSQDAWPSQTQRPVSTHPRPLVWNIFFIFQIFLYLEFHLASPMTRWQVTASERRNWKKEENLWVPSIKNVSCNKNLFVASEKWMKLFPDYYNINSYGSQLS